MLGFCLLAGAWGISSVVDWVGPRGGLGSFGGERGTRVEVGWVDDLEATEESGVRHRGSGGLEGEWADEGNIYTSELYEGLGVDIS